VKKHGLAAGIVVTASHNPKEDNGYKVYWENSAQIIPPVDKKIADRIEKELSPWFVPTMEGVDERCEFWDEKIVDEYMEEVAPMSRFRGLLKKPLLVTYTAMHGVGAPFVQRVFEEFGLPPYVPVKEQIDPNPDFPTVVFPNPEEGASALNLAFRTGSENQSKVILANDPDADRLAVAEYQESSHSWRVFNGNETALLFADYAWQHLRTDKTKPASNYLMIAATSASKIVRRMAEVEGFRYEETLNGFKWIGNKVLEKKQKEGLEFLFGFEAEIGFLLQDVSLDKDGVRAAACMAEYASWLYETHQITLAQKLESLYAKYGHFVMIARYFYCYDPAQLARIFDQMRDPHYFTTVGNAKVTWLRDLTRDYQTDTTDHRATLPCSKSSQFIAFRLDSGVDVTLRTSGTEPKLKYYVEAFDLSDGNRAQLLAEQTVDAVIRELLKPEQNGLIRP
jgi:phosphoglucomutase